MKKAEPVRNKEKKYSRDVRDNAETRSQRSQGRREMYRKGERNCQMLKREGEERRLRKGHYLLTVKVNCIKF